MSFRTNLNTSFKKRHDSPPPSSGHAASAAPNMLRTADRQGKSIDRSHRRFRDLIVLTSANRTMSAAWEHRTRGPMTRSSSCTRNPSNVNADNLAWFPIPGACPTIQTASVADRPALPSEATQPIAEEKYPFRCASSPRGGKSAERVHGKPSPSTTLSQQNAFFGMKSRPFFVLHEIAPARILTLNFPCLFV